MNRLNKIGIFNRFNVYRINMRSKRQQNMVLLRAYFKKQKSIIVSKTIKKMIKGVMWTALLSGCYYYMHQIYSDKLQVRQMNLKLSKIYPQLCTIIKNSNQHEVIYVKPQYKDQLANIISMCWKYHYKIIINNQDLQSFSLGSKVSQFTKDLPEQVRNKCIFLNISNLKDIKFQEVDQLISLQCGNSCKQINQILQQKGYEPIFLKELEQQKVFDIIVNNLPLKNGNLWQKLNSLQIISPEGQYFMSTNKNNMYGQIPNLNSLFIGSGGIFGIPTKANFNLLRKKQQQEILIFQINSNDLNQKIITLRNINDFLLKNKGILDLCIKKTLDKKENLIFKLSKQHQRKKIDQTLQQLQKQVPSLKLIEGIQSVKSNQTQNYNIFFNVSKSIFQKFILRDSNPADKIYFQYKDNLLKLTIQNEKLIGQIVSELTLQNGVLVWCKNKKYMRQIKRSTDQGEVGAELMKKLVQIREGLDHKKIIFNHNRYEEYFSKGMFRKLTQIFW